METHYIFWIYPFILNVFDSRPSENLCLKSTRKHFVALSLIHFRIPQYPFIMKTFDYTRTDHLCLHFVNSEETKIQNYDLPIHEERLPFLNTYNHLWLHKNNPTIQYLIDKLTLMWPCIEKNKTNTKDCLEVKIGNNRGDKCHTYRHTLHRRP